MMWFYFAWGFYAGGAVLMWAMVRHDLYGTDGWKPPLWMRLLLVFSWPAWIPAFIFAAMFEN